ncbi:MAG: hypothetical protein AABY04_00080, partial [Candidatus Micrarchaeota archaeon]
MGLTSSVTILLIALLVLGFSSSRVVSLLTGISSKLKMPKFLLSFVVLGLGTSLPDLFVTSTSTRQMTMMFAPMIVLMTRSAWTAAAA